MQNTSNAAVVTGDRAGGKTGAEKISEKVVEKRRALGRGLESLLPSPQRAKTEPARDPGPGPRVVTPAAAHVQTDRIDEAPGPASALISSSSPSSSSSAFTSSSGIDLGVEGEGAAPVAPSMPVVDLHAAGQATDSEPVLQLEIDRIDRNPYQTRGIFSFDEKTLMELAQSIHVQGVLQPIMVRPGKDGRFTLILGERRLRASRLAGMKEIPAIVKRVSDQQAAEMTVVENLQRQDLNCVDQADAFAKLSREFKLTQEQIGARVGLSRETVSNYMRLLTLGDGIIGALQKGTLAYSHARALLMVQDTAYRWTLAKRVMEEKWSVAKLEAVVQGMALPRASEKSRKEGGARWVDPNVKAAQRSLEEVLGMRVRIRDQHGRGKILIEYSTIDDFDRVVRMLKGN